MTASLAQHSWLGAGAALAASATWAFASTRYAQASRSLGSARINLLRAITVLPLFALGMLYTSQSRALDGFTVVNLLWLLGSVVCSYALADSLFFSAARRIGISSALAVASCYPVWAAFTATLWGGERFGLLRGSGLALCVSGVIALTRLEAHRPDFAELEPNKISTAARWRGFALAFVTSLMWAGNSISIKRGAIHLSVWQANAARYLMAAALLAAGLRISKPRHQVARPALLQGWRLLLPAVIADAFFGSIFYVFGLSNTDLAVGATLSSLAPLLSVPIAIVLGEEHWSPARFAAVLVTVTGVLLLIVGS